MLVTYLPSDAVARPRRSRGPDRAVSEGSTAARLPLQASRLLELQRTAGNRAVTFALQRSVDAGSPAVQRLDWEDAVDFLQWTNPLTAGNKALRQFTGVELNTWALAEQAVRASATKISIPELYVDELRKYAAANPADGKILLNALAQAPSHYRGGLLLAAQKDAEAITFGNSIFYGEDPSLATFIHEMVHINQYHVLGRKAFVLSYFGLSLATIIKRVLQGKPVEAMKSSPHEAQAYELEGRFKKWRSGT